jgi:hypothetical protein
MEQSSLRVADSLLASQEIAYPSMEPEVHYCIHKHLISHPIQSQMNPVHIHTLYFLKIQCNIIPPSKPMSPQVIFSVGFLTKCYMHAICPAKQKHFRGTKHWEKLY